MCDCNFSRKEVELAHPPKLCKTFLKKIYYWVLMSNVSRSILGVTWFGMTSFILRKLATASNAHALFSFNNITSEFSILIIDLFENKGLITFRCVFIYFRTKARLVNLGKKRLQNSHIAYLICGVILVFFFILASKNVS